LYLGSVPDFGRRAVLLLTKASVVELRQEVYARLQYKECPMRHDSEDSDIHDCKVCYAPHDDEIHEATLRVHRWLNRELSRKLNNGWEPAQEFAEPAVAELQVA